MCTSRLSRFAHFVILLPFLLALQAAADSGRTFYFPLPGNSIGRFTGESSPDNLRSVYHLVVERAPGAAGSADPQSPDITFSLQFLHGGEVYTYSYLNSDSTMTEIRDIAVNYGKPFVVEIETMFDPDGPSGPIEPILVSTDEDLEGGVQEGVFRLLATDDVRLLLYNVDGPYIDPVARPSPLANQTDPNDNQYGPMPYDGQFSPDVTRLFPINNLGTEYTLNIDVPDRMVLNGRPKASVTVVATRDGTNIDFVASPLMQNGGDGSIGAPSSVVLDRGQRWTLTTDEYRLMLVGLADGDGPTAPIAEYYIDSAINLFNGMKIKASKPVAVLTAGGCATVRQSACDQTLAQLLPDRLLGTRHFIPVMPRGWGDGFDFRVVASERVEALTVVVKAPFGISTSTSVVDQSRWNGTDKVQEFVLATPSDPMLPGDTWEVVWTALGWLANPTYSAERPGIDAVNNRLVLAFGQSNLGSTNEWKAVLQEENDDSFPAGYFDAGGGYFTPCMVAIESDAPVSVVASSRPASPSANNLAIQAPDEGGWVDQSPFQQLAEDPSALMIGAGGMSCDDYWDVYCEQAVDGGIFYTGSGYFEESKRGYHVDPARIPIPHAGLFENTTSIAVPSVFAETFVGDVAAYEVLNTRYCADNVPFVHYALVVVKAEYVDPTGDEVLAVRRSYNVPQTVQSQFSSSVSDTDWVPITDPQGGWWDSFTETDIFESFTVCGEIFDYPTDQQTDFNLIGLPTIIGGNTSSSSMGGAWSKFALPGTGNESEYVATVVRLFPFDYPDIQNLFPSDVRFPYDAASQIEPGDLVPVVPVTTYQFAVGTVSGSTFTIEPGDDDALMVYSFGSGYFGTYAYTGSIPKEDPPDDELVISDEIPLVVGNSIIDSSVSLLQYSGTRPTGTAGSLLSEGEDYIITESSDGTYATLVVTMDPSTLVEDYIEILYELQLQDLESGSTRRVGNRTELEHVSIDPTTGQPRISVIERGVTDIPIGQGPIQLAVTSPVHNDSSPAQFSSPDQDIPVVATLDFASSGALYHQILGSLSELTDPDVEYNGVRAIEGGGSGHDQLRVGVLMLDRQSASTQSDFVGTGTVSLIFDAGRVVRWNDLSLLESIPQPQLPGGTVDVSGASSSLVSVDARGAGSIGQILQWREDSTGENEFASLGESDGDPETPDAEFNVTDIESRFLEVRMQFNRFDPDPGTSNDLISPVVDSVTASYSPSQLVLELDITDEYGNSVYELRASSVDPGVVSHQLQDGLFAGELLDGIHYARASVIDQSLDMVLETARSIFEVVPAGTLANQLAGEVTTDQGVYLPSDIVEIRSVVQNISPQYIGTDILVSLKVFRDTGGIDDCGDTNSEEIFAFPAYRLTSMLPGQEDVREFAFRVPSSTEPGVYRVVQSIDDEATSSQQIQCNYADFTVESTVSYGYGLEGALSLSSLQIPDSLGNEFVAIDIEIQNTGNLPLTDVALAVVAEQIDGGLSQTTILELDVAASLDPGTLETYQTTWMPSIDGTYVLHYYARSDELNPGSTSSYSTWSELSMATVHVNGLTGEVVQPWYIAIELEPGDPLTGTSQSSELGDDDYRGGVNSRGEVVGLSRSTTIDAASFWRNCQQPENLHTQVDFVLSGVGDFSYATDVSSDGSTVGIFDDSVSGQRSFYLNNLGELFELTVANSVDSTVVSSITSSAMDTTAVGWTVDGALSEAVVWRDIRSLTPVGDEVQSQTNLEFPAGTVESRLLDLNEQGFAVGWINDGTRTIAMWVDNHDVVHTSDGGQSNDVRLYAVSNESDSGITVLGTYEDALGNEIPFQALLGINNFTIIDELSRPVSDQLRPLAKAKLGTVVGYMQTGSDDTAYLWERENGIDLNDAVLNGHFGWDLDRAVDITDSAKYIAGVGYLGSDERAVRLERVQYEQDLLDQLHLWVRADAGLTLATSSTDILGWDDLTGGIKSSDNDLSSTFALGTGGSVSPTYSQADCCDYPVVRFSAPSSVFSVDGLVDDSGAALSGDATFAIVFVPAAIHDGGGTGEVVVAEIGDTSNGSRLEIIYDELGLVSVRSGSETRSLGFAPLNDPILVILRQSEPSGGNATVDIWRDALSVTSINTSSPLDWDEVTFARTLQTDDDFGVIEVMMFESAITDAQIGEVQDELRTRHRIGNPIASEDVNPLMWVRSDRSVESDGNTPDLVTRWGAHAGSWGDLVPGASGAPEYRQSYWGPCLPSIYFDGSTLLGGVGPADIIIVLDKSSSMLASGGVALPDDVNVCGTHGSQDDNDRFVFARHSARELAARALGSGNLFGHEFGLLSFQHDEDGTLGDDYDELALTDIDQIEPGIQSFSGDFDLVTDRICMWASADMATSDPWESQIPYPSGNGTHIPAALNLAASTIVNRVEDRKAIVFLSDGDPDFYYQSGSRDSWSAIELFSSDPAHTSNAYSMHDSLQQLMLAGIPVHTIGFGVDPDADSTDIDLAAHQVLRNMSDLAGDGGISQFPSDADDLNSAFLELDDLLTAVVSDATIALTFSAEDVPGDGEAPRVLMQAGSLESVNANGINVWLADDQVHIGVWWSTTTGTVKFRSIRAPYIEIAGLSQLVIEVWGGEVQLYLKAYLNGAAITTAQNNGGGSTVPSGSGSAGDFDVTPGGQHGFGLDPVLIQIESQGLEMSDLNLGNSSAGKARVGQGDPVLADGFVGDIVELLVYDKRLESDDLDALFDWGVSRYGAGTETRGFAPVAIASSGGVGDQGYFDTNFNGVETVVLDATGTQDPDDLQSTLRFDWYNGDTLIGSGITTSVTLPIGRHYMALRATDPAGHVSVDRFVVDVHRVMYRIKAVDVPFSNGPLTAAGDPVPPSMLVAVDSSKEMHVRGAHAKYESGRSATAIDLAGSSYLDLSDAASEIPSGSSPRTFSVWFETGVTEHDEPTLFAQSDQYGERRFAITGNRRRVAYTVGEYTRGVEWLDPVDQLAVGWHHLVVVVSTGALWSDQVRMYLNGTELRTVPLDGSVAPVNLYTGESKVFVGADPLYGNQISYQGGRIDELQIISGAITPSEVLDLYNKVPVSSWTFEQEGEYYSVASTAIVATDVSTLVLSDGASVNESGRLKLSSKSQANIAGAVFPSAQGNWTVVFQVVPELSTPELDPIVSDSTGPLLLLHEDASGAPMLYVSTTGSSVPAPNLFDGQPHWIGIVSRKNYPGVSDGTYLFIDGDVDFASPLSSSGTMLDGSAIHIAGPNSLDGGFEGYIDNFHIFDRPLDEAEYLELIGLD